jgi:hypothetical protein
MKFVFALVAAALLAGCGAGQPGTLFGPPATPTPEPVATPNPKPSPKPGDWMWQKNRTLLDQKPQR